MAIVSDWNSYEYDLCIIGAGPVGMSLAMECESFGLSVLLLEGGALTPGAEEPAGEAITDPARHAPLGLASSRAFGGTSWRWGGRCVPLDDIDFERRSFVDTPGWPIGHGDLEPFYQRAATYLDCGNAEFTSPPPSPWALPGIQLDSLERWARQPRLTFVHRDRIEQSKTVSLCLGQRITGLKLDPEGHHLTELKVRNKAGEATAHARQYVIACGGLETTRLLLLTQREWPRHFGGASGPLGRYYAGHLTGRIATIHLTSPADVVDLDFDRDATQTFVRRRFTIPAEEQRRNEILNTVFWLDNMPLFDPTHRNGALSLIHLVLCCPPLARLFAPEAIRRAHKGSDDHRVAEHLRNVLANIPESLGDLRQVVANRAHASGRKPDLVLRNAGGRYAIQYHAEQLPNPESRVTLGHSRDAAGVPALAIDFRFSVEDARSVLRAHELLDQGLRHGGKGYLEYWKPPEERIDQILFQATDGYHQLGTTRMSAVPADGVVDSECRVHGIDNLFVASSSIFSTAGQANPTFPAAAFAVRLASALARRTNRVATINT